MKTKNLSKLSTEDLQKQLKTLKILNSAFIGVLIVLFIASIALTFKKGFSPSLVVALCLLPILILNFKNITEMKKELDLREKV